MWSIKCINHDLPQSHMERWRTITETHAHLWCFFLSGSYTLLQHGWLPTIRHNEIRDFTANAMSETCHDVCIKPPLQALTTEPLPHATSNRDDGARLDLRTQGFWCDRHRRAFFDVRVFYSNAPSYRDLQLGSVYHWHEKEKRSYKDRVREVEDGSFTHWCSAHLVAWEHLPLQPT